MQDLIFSIPEGATEMKLQLSDPLFSVPSPNQLPIVNAGIDQTVNTQEATLTGKASDPDGIISVVTWEILQGSGTIASPNSLTTKVSGLGKGTNIFRLSALDNNGASAFDDVGITYNEVVTPPPTDGYTLVYKNGFDNDSDIRNSTSQQAGKGVISRTNFKEGTGSFLSIPENVSSGIRSEVQFTSSIQCPKEGAVEYWVFYETVVANNCCSLQNHPHTTGSSGSPYLMHDGSKFTWVVWGIKTSSGIGNAYYPTGITIEKGKWMKFRVEFKFALSGGYLIFYIDGKKVFEKLNIQLGDSSGGYWKCGFNSWSSEGYNSRIYYDGWTIYKKG